MKIAESQALVLARQRHATNESPFVRWTRRALSIGTVTAGLAGLTLLFPFLVPIALVRDIVFRTKWASIRTLLFFECLLALECAGVALSFAAWLAEAPYGRASRDRFMARNYRLQNWWGCALAGAAQRIFGIRLQVEGLPAELTRPFMLFVRHASFADALLPVLLISSRFKTWLRYVMKKELLWDPCLDIVGHRIPNVFVDRHSEDSASQIESVRQLAQGLGDGEGILIYPEGTRYTPAKHRRIMDRMRAEGGAVYERASRFASVLPPRLGGTTAILEAARGFDAVFCAHSGLEDAVTLRHLLSGSLVGRCVRIRFWTVGASEIPAGRESVQRWFLEQWEAMDHIVTEWNAERIHA